MAQDPTPVDLGDLPEAITRYLAGRAARNAPAAAAAFAPQAAVTDDGRTHRGAEAITRWLGQTDTEYTYTTTLTGAERDAADRYTLHQHLEGDFPGGTVDLRCRFVLTARRPHLLDDWAARHGDRVLVRPLDVTDTPQVHDAVQAAHEHFGRIDVLVNNAGRSWTP